MSTWFRSRTGTIALLVFSAVVGLILFYLLVAAGQDSFSERSVSASLLIMGFLIFTVGGFLYTGRAIWKLPVGQTLLYLYWERGFVIAALLANVLGLVLLDDVLAAGGVALLARIGTVTYLMGAAVVLVAESAFVGKQEWNYAQVVLYVVLAFLAQACIGAALLNSGLVAAWVAWAVILWNIWAAS